nr:1-phosphofructokinase [Lentibacillus sp. Marseille-P4043]
MILTVTLNPAVDVSYKLDQFALDSVNRIRDVSKTAGGKGLNVSRVLKLLGEDIAATGFLGGSLGNFIQSQLVHLGIHDFFVPIQGESRNCIAVIHEGRQTEILESGPVIKASETNDFLGKFTEYVRKVDLVTISGSLPKGLTNDFYEKLIDTAGNNDTSVLLDTKGELLEHTLKGISKPYLIKPNQEELADLLKRKLTNEADIIDAMKSAMFADVEWVVVTLGSEGALVKHNEVMYRAKPPKVEAVNPVGSGDSVIAGFAAGLSRGFINEELIKFGLAMGVLNAMEEKTGHINPEKIDWCMENIQVEEIAIGG